MAASCEKRSELTAWYYITPARDLLNQGVNVRQPRPIRESRQSICASNEIDLGTSALEDRRVEHHCQEKRRQRRDGLRLDSKLVHYTYQTRNSEGVTHGIRTASIEHRSSPLMCILLIFVEIAVVKSRRCERRHMSSLSL